MSCRLAEIQELLPKEDKQITFLHVKSEHNVADWSTRLCFKMPEEIPFYQNGGNLVIDESFHSAPQSKILSDLPDVKRKEMTVQNQMLSFPQITLQNILSVQLPLEKISAPKEPVKHVCFDLVNRLLERNCFKRTVNILSRILRLLNQSLDEHSAREKSLKLIFCAYQQEAQKYVESFGGHLFAKVSPTEKGEPTYLQVRENKVGKQFLLLVPRHTLLFTKIVEYVHNETGHRSELYTRMWTVRNGYYLPNALPSLAKYRRSCVVCKKRADVRIIVKQGHIGDRLSPTAFMENICSDFAGHFWMKNPVNHRSRRKYWLMISICDMSRYISITVVEDLSSKAILRALQKHHFRYGPTKQVHSDLGSNYRGAQRFLREQSEDEISFETMKEVQDLVKPYGITLKTRVSHAPYMMGSAESSVKIVKQLWPKTSMSYFEMEFMAEKIMSTINSRPLSLSNAGQNLCPNDLRPLHNNAPDNEKSNDFIAAHETLQKTIESFEQTWLEVYSLSVLKMKKWLQDSITLQIGDLVCLSDIKPNYQQLALVEAIKKDTNGHPQYFTISYISNGKRKTIDRPGSSLCFLLTKAEREQGKIQDPLSYLPENVQKRKKTKVLVSHPHDCLEMTDMN